MPDTILATSRPINAPGLAGHARLPAGLSLAEMVTAMPDLPADFMSHGAICVNGREAPRALWSSIRPKPRAVTEVAFFHAPEGGGDEGGKNPLALIASVALLAATGWVAGGGLAARFGAGFAAGTVGANLATVGLSLAGQALIGSMAPAPGLPAPAQADAAGAGTASAKGNVVRPNGPVTRVLGTRKVFPAFACEPFVWYDGQDEMVEAVCVLSGPHQLEDLRLGSARIDEMPGVEYEVHEGWPGDPRLSLVTRFSRSDELRSELQGFVLEEDGLTVDQLADGGYLPQPIVLATRDAPDEYRIGITFAQGLNQNGDEDIRLRVPLRIRLRRRGSETWQNLPELHYVGTALRDLRATIRLVWADSPAVAPDMAATTGFVEARIASPDQSVAPVGGGWQAESSFDAGSGDDWLVSNNLNDTAVQNVVGGRHEVTITLDTSSFPTGQYEVEITRGAAILNSDYVTADYEVSGTVWDLFGVQGEAAKQIVRKQSDIVSALYVARGSSIWNRHPVPTDEFAVIALRARNQQLQPLSVVASGYVQDWDGAAWASWTTSSNPAPHLRDVLTGRLNARPVPLDIVDDDDLVTWRARCATEGFEINAIIEGGSVGDALARTAAAGFGLPRMSNTWGVVDWRDTSAEDPAFIFTDQTLQGFGFRKEYTDIPAGIRATFRDADRDYTERQIVHPPDANPRDLEQRSYEDKVTEAEVRQAVEFDLAQLREQSALFSGTVPAVSLAVRRGDLVGIQSDMLTHRVGSGRVVDYTVDGSGDLTSMTLDAEATITNEPDFLSVTDFLAVTDVLAIGLTPVLKLRPAGLPVETHALSNASGSTRVLTLATAAASDIHEDAEAAVGPSETVLRRMIVADIQRGERLTAELTFVDEMTWTP